MRRTATAGAALAVTVIALMSVAGSSLAAAPITFDGQCQFTGTSTFSSPVTLTPSRVGNDVTAAGTCSGSVSEPNGATTQLSNAPVQYQASELGTSESCESDLGASGSGALVLPQGSLDFRVVENRLSGQAVLSYTGRNGGSAQGFAYVNTSDPAGLLQQCDSGGITSAPVSIVFQTSPTITG